MKALVLTGVKTPLELQQRADLTPDPGTVVVALKAAALNRRDYWITQGLYPGIEPPTILGSDGAGIVTSVGAGVSVEWVEKEVILYPGIQWGNDEAAQGADFTILGSPSDGTFATQIKVDASQVHSKPAQLHWNEAAALPLAGVTAYRALFSQGELQEGQSVLITGIGGGVAAFALQFAVAAGAQVSVTSSSPEKIARAISLGATAGYDYREPDWHKTLAKDCGPPHLVIDGAGGDGYRNLLQVAAPGGRIVNYGATAGPSQLDMFRVFWKQLRIIGSTLGSPRDFSDMIRFVEDHQIKPMVDSVVPLADGNEAINQMASSPQFGKYVLEMD